MALQGCHELTRLEFGDVMLTGHGPGDSTLSVGIEVKSASGLIRDIETGRLGGHQIPGLIKSYDRAWLLIYGSVRPSAGNVLELYRHGRWIPQSLGARPMPWSYIEGWLLTLQYFTPVRVKWVYNEEEAAKWIVVMDKWLSKKWDQHRGMSQFNESQTQAPLPGADPIEELMANVASRLPGIGQSRGWDAAKHFNSVEEMINAPASEWQKVNKIGPVIAKATREIIRRKK